ncbi:glycosyltransferase family 4 protein [Flavobacterium limnophilum]|uniref:glycosyltransferase family 4 protein n=1 Tax=Flavobacterium limnophilum TaxID=3003262 RepID=UPI00248233A4|nr:glycosyltransferase family 4 protein [Flavobacterium limnophilum]
MIDKRKIVYLGFNSMFGHKRGVENVIHFQSQASPSNVNYYLHWDFKTSVKRYEKLICIGVKKNRFWFITLNIILIKLRKRNDFFFIHSHNPLMSIMSLYQSNLFTVHDALYYLTNARGYRLNKFFFLLEKILYLRCVNIHFISDYAKKMSLYRKKNNFIIIPNTSHFEKYNINDELPTNLRVFKEDVMKVFTVRSIEERALINLIIEIAIRLKEVKIEFLIAGKGPLLDFYQKRVKELQLENVTLLGFVSDNDLIQYYRNCDLVLIPAAYGEGFGLPIIEGYLFDKPVISSNACAIPDVIISDDFLFENNVESLIDRIDYLRYKSKYNYRSYYDEYFSNKVIISKMSRLYNEIMLD